MKKYFLFAIMALAMIVTSCKNQNVNEPTIDEGQLVAQEGDFIATIADGSIQNAPAVSGGNSTMAEFQGTKVLWQVGDTISINNNPFKCEQVSGAALFRGITPTTFNDNTTVHAFFPKSIAGTDAAGTLPGSASNPLNAADYTNANKLPMYATTTVQANTTSKLTFSNICAVITITIPASLKTATSIEISTTTSTACLNGAFTINNNTPNAPYAQMTGGVTADRQKLTITGPFSAGMTLYIPIPANGYNDLTVDFVGTTYSKTATFTGGKNFAVNTIYNFPVIVQTPLCFTANENGCTVSTDIEDLLYSSDGSSWSTTTFTSTTLNNGEKLYLKYNDSTTPRVAAGGNFTTTGNVSVSGNILSLLNGGTITGREIGSGAFAGLFAGCSITDASGLVLPTKTDEGCYYGMFNGCTSLTDAPALPATTLASQCYEEMFYGCTSLQTAPALPATTLEYECYGSMFSECTSLTTAPALPATTLAEYCYMTMFSDCYSLTSVTMKATDVSADGCLSGWLDNAGTSASSRTVTINSGLTNTTGTAGATITSETPSNWTISNGTNSWSGTK